MQHVFLFFFFFAFFFLSKEADSFLFEKMWVHSTACLPASMAQLDVHLTGDQMVASLTGW